MHKLVATAVCTLLGFTGIASAQTDSIVILTTYPATGSSSRATTILAPKLEEILGRDIRMEYDVGARGGVAVRPMKRRSSCQPSGIWRYCQPYRNPSVSIRSAI